MSYENGIALFDAVTNIDERLIEQAEDYTFHKSGQRLFRTVSTAAATVAVLVGISAFLLLSEPGMKASGNVGHTDPEYYEAPVLPLAALTDTDGLTAERRTGFDLSEMFSWVMLTGDYLAEITDSYTITNTTEEDITLQAAYPYSGDLGNVTNRTVPTITVDGAETDTEVYAGSYAAKHNDVYDNGRYFGNFSDYEMLLSDGGYLKNAAGSVPSLDVPVTVYRVTDYGYNGLSDGGDPNNLAVNMQFSSDHAMVLSIGFNSYRNNMDGSYRFGFFLPGPTTIDSPYHRYIIVVDGEVSSMSIQGYKDGGCRDGDEIDGVFGTIVKTDLGLEDIIREYAEKNDAINCTDQVFIDKIAEHLADTGVLADQYEGFRGGFLNDLIGTVYTIPRLMYRIFEVTVPAGGSVNITAASQKAASRLYDESKERYFAFELATTLGSEFVFTSQTAYISGAGSLEIYGDIGEEPQELDIKQPFYSIKAKPSSLTKN